MTTIQVYNHKHTQNAGQWKVTPETMKWSNVKTTGMKNISVLITLTEHVIKRQFKYRHARSEITTQARETGKRCEKPVLFFICAVHCLMYSVKL